MNPQDQQQNNAGSPGSSQPSDGSPGKFDSEQPQVVYMTRPLEPSRQPMSPEIQQKHEESKRAYPNLNLSQGEYIISAVKRHPIGLISIWIVTFVIILSLCAVVGVIAAVTRSSNFGGNSIPIMYLAIPAVLVSMIVLMFGFISSWIYRGNRFYLTNESVIQHIQTSLFSQREQTISLANIEDASFSQDGIMSHIFNYGLIRLSTQGDETTYRFTLASSPQQQIALLNNAVEDFKNVRPMED
jgi:membrane protein YdbS with pleckstrin-like domain